MSGIRVILVVRGLTEDEFAGGLPAFTDEFKQRDRLTHGSATWDASRGGLVITIDCETKDATVSGETTLDEVRESVMVSLQRLTDNYLEIVESSFTSVA